MKRITYKLSLVVLVLALSVVLNSCQDLNPLPEQNPAALTDATPEGLLTTVQLLNLTIQNTELTTYSMGFTRQLLGAFFRDIIDNKDLARQSREWNDTYRLLANVDAIEERTDDPYILAIARIMEADAIRHLANFYGDIPYSEAGTPLENLFPKLDSQLDVYNAAIELLTWAIDTLTPLMNSSRTLENDVLYGRDESDIARWLAVAYSLRARAYLELKDYPNALESARNGISSSEDDLQWASTGIDLDEDDDKNWLWVDAGARRDITTDDTYLEIVLNDRENAKTTEDARAAYYEVPEERIDVEDPRIVNGFTPMKLITYHETLLILAECSARAGDLDGGINYLNMLRSNLMNGRSFTGGVGGLVRQNVIPDVDEENIQEKKYDAYELADFEAGGMENTDNIATDRALLREIIEERYVSLFLSSAQFNDARRLRKDDSDLLIPFNPPPPPPLTSVPLIERFPYPVTVSSSNPNVPQQNMDDEEPSIFEPTQINR